MPKSHIKSDGNGGIIVSKSLLAIATLLLVVGSSFASVVAYSVGMSSDINHIQEGFNSYVNSHDTVHNKLDGTITTLQNDISDLKTSCARIETKLTSMQEDISEIKNGRFT